MSNIKLPSPDPLTAAEVRSLVAAFGGARPLADAIGSTHEEVAAWTAHGVRNGVTAMCLRFVRREIRRAPKPPTDGVCLLCGQGAHRVVVPQISLCNTCLFTPETIVGELGLTMQRGASSVSMTSTIPFQKPLHATLSRQRKPAGDVEIGDEDFDAGVRIETDDYEALFDCLQSRRRRILAFHITRYAKLTINVNEVHAVRSFLRLPEHLPALVAVLAWSLANERPKAPWTEAP